MWQIADSPERQSGDVWGMEEVGLLCVVSDFHLVAALVAATGCDCLCGTFVVVPGVSLFVFKAKGPAFHSPS